MEYRKYMNLFIVGLALASFSVFAWRQLPLTAAAQTVSLIKPLTATYSIATYLPNGQLVASETRGYALRSDAASVVLFYRPSPIGGSKLVSINAVKDLVGQRSVRVMPFITSKVTYPMTQAQVSQERAKASARCAGEPADPILGYAVVKAREVSNFEFSNEDGDRMQFDRWLAPGLNCMPLRTEVTISNSKDNKVLQRSVETYIEIREGDPDSALFRIPDDYVELTPTGAANEAARRFPNDPNFGPRQSNMTQLDDVYANARKKTGAPR